MELNDDNVNDIFQEAVNHYLDTHGLMGFIRNVVKEEMKKNGSKKP